MSPLNITQPLGIWSIMATIRWCPIYPKWDSYQPLQWKGNLWISSCNIRLWKNHPDSCPGAGGPRPGPKFMGPWKLTAETRHSRSPKLVLMALMENQSGMESRAFCHHFWKFQWFRAIVGQWTLDELCIYIRISCILYTYMFVWYMIL